MLLKNALLDLTLDIDVKQLKKSHTSGWKPIQKTLEWNLNTMQMLVISGIEANKKNCCARDATTLY